MKPDRTNTTAAKPVTRLSCSSAPIRPYADSTRPPIVPERPSCLVVCTASSTIKRHGRDDKDAGDTVGQPADACACNAVCGNRLRLRKLDVLKRRRDFAARPLWRRAALAFAAAASRKVNDVSPDAGRARAQAAPRPLVADEPEERALTGLGVVVHENVGDADALHPDRQAQIRHPLYDRRPEAACERVFFQRKESARGRRRARSGAPRRAAWRSAR